MRVLGDFDGDNKITMNDYLLLNSYINGIVTLTAEQLEVADVNQDGVVDYNDVYALYAHNKLMNIITEVTE